MAQKFAIKFLGTSAGWPLPRLGCGCRICTSSDPRDKRKRPSILVNERVLIDAPPDLYQELMQHEIETNKLEYLLLTHAHDDHIMGLFDLSKTYGQDKKITLVTTAGVLNEVQKKMRISLLSFKKLVVKPFEKIDLGKNVHMWMIPVSHTVVTYGIKLKVPKPILYAPEFRRIKPSSRKLLGDLDLAVIDGSSKGKKGQAKGHQSIEAGIRLGKDIGAKKIYFTNIGHATDTHEELTEFVKSRGDDRFNIAFDGLELKV